MNVGPAEQVFEEILPYLETLDAQIGGIVQLLKGQGHHHSGGVCPICGTGRQGEQR
jgi:hypothetical protein